MELGAFSVSLAVKDLAKSRAFYEALGFKHFHGESEHKFHIMKNGDTVIGLFEGMFEDNILTFNPGWDNSANELPEYTDVRQLQQTLKRSGVSFETEVDEAGSGPGSFVIRDPDGNLILVDQHR